MAQRHLSAVELTTAPAISDHERERLVVWDSFPEIKVYEFLRQHAGEFKISHAANTLRMAKATVYNYLEWLTENKFVECIIQDTKRVIRVKEVPESTGDNKRTVHNRRGYVAINEAGIDGRPCSFDELSAEEAVDIVTIVQQVDPNMRTPEYAVDVYEFLRTSQGQVYFMEELYLHVGSEYCVRRAIKALSKANLIRLVPQTGMNVFHVFPVQKDFSMYSDEEITVWLKSATNVFEDDGRTKRKTSKTDADRLLDLYYALLRDRQRFDATERTKNRSIAIRMMRNNTYEDLRGQLVYFVLNPNFFEGVISSELFKKGASLEAFYLNLRKVGEAIDNELKTIYKDGLWWKRLLKGDLADFLPDEE